MHHDARGQFEKLLTKDPNNPEILKWLAKVDSEEHRIADGLKKLNKAILYNPNDPSLYSDIGYFYVEHYLGPDKAEKAFKKALELSPGYVPALAGLGRLYCSILQYDKAEENLRRALQREPNSDLAHVFLGEVLFRKGKFAESEYEYKEAVRISPDNPNNYFELGEFYYDLGDFDKALVAYKKGMIANPENRYSKIGALRVLGQVYVVRGDYEKAGKVLKELVRIDPDNAPTRTVIGDLYFEQNRRKDAEKEYSLALKANPRYPMAHAGLGYVYRDAHKYKESEDSFRKAIEMNKETPEGYQGLGELLTQLGRYEEAESVFKKVLEINPASLDALVGLGDIEMGRGKIKEALSVYDKALSRSGGRSISVHLSIAKAMAKKGAYAEARKHYEQAKLINPYEADAECGLGDIELINGDPESAEKYFRSALDKDADYSYALYRLSISLIRQGREREALEIGKRLLLMGPPISEWSKKDPELGPVLSRSIKQ